MTLYQIVAAVSAGTGGLFFLLRARLLCREAGGWPHASLPVRVALMLAAAAVGGRGLQIVLRGQEVDPSEAGIYLLIGVYAVTMGVNLWLQRAGWPLDWRPHAGGGAAARHNGHGHAEDRADPPRGHEPPSFLEL